MKRILFLFFISICFFCNSSFFLFHTGINRAPANDSSANKISIFISDTNVTAVNPRLFGFSVDNLYSEISNPYDTNFVKAVKGLSPQVFRWPGGNVSNYVHALENGYGYMKSQVQGADVRVALKMERQGLFEMQTHVDHPYIQDFVQLVRSCGAKVLVVANVVTGTPEECVEQLNYFKESGVDVIGVEVGSDLFQQNIRTVYRFPGSYMIKASLFVTAIRKSFPGLKVGACVAPYNKTGDVPMNSGEFSFFKSWNDAIVRNNIFDAISIHCYLPVTVKQGLTTDSAFRVAARDLARLYSPSGVVSLSMEYYAQAFPKNKIWMTEWNIAPQMTQGFFLNTLLQGIYSQAFLHFLNNYNARHNSPIEIATFSVLASGGRSGNSGLITLRQEKEKLPGVFIKRVPYYAFENIKEIFDQNHVALQTVTDSFAQAVFYAYKDTTGKTLSLYWSNFSGKDLTVDRFVLGKDTLGPEQLVTVRCVHGELSSSYGFSKFSRTNLNKPPDQENKEMNLSQVKFYGNSFGYLKLKTDSASFKSF